MIDYKANRPVHGGNLAWAAEVAGCSPDSLLDFSASIVPFGPPASVLTAIHEAIAHLTHYPDPGYGELRGLLGRHHQLPDAWILPGNGVAELLTWACRELAALGATALVTPAFSDYRRGMRAFQGRITPYSLLSPVGDLRSREVLAQLERSPAPGLLLNSPHNPTGYCFSRQDLQPLLERFELLVVDEAFMDFLPPDRQESLIESVGSYPQLVVLRSLTKFYRLPGLRLGYAVGHPDRLNRWRQWRDPWPVNALASAAAIALEDRAFQQQVWQWLGIERPSLLAALAAISGLHPLPGAANFLLVRSEASVPPLQTALLRRHRIVIRDCLSFPELGDRYFRVAIRTQAENHRLTAALRDCLETLV